MPIDPGGIAVFTGNNWAFGPDANGKLVFGQADVGNDKLAVSQNGVTLTQINDSQRYIPSQGRVRTWQGNQYYVSTLQYTWSEANDQSYWDGILGDGWHPAIVSSAQENELIRTLANGKNVRLGGYDVWGTTHNSWSLKWVNGTTITDSSGYSNFAAEPNDYNDEDYLMMWTNGLWNDVNASTELYVVLNGMQPGAVPLVP